MGEGIWGMHKSKGVFTFRTLTDGDKPKTNCNCSNKKREIFAHRTDWSKDRNGVALFRISNDVIRIQLFFSVD